MTRYLSLVVLAALASATVAEETCATFGVDFGQFNRGDYITTELMQNYGIEVECESTEGFGCRIFDTAVPYGEWGAGHACECALGQCTEDEKNNCGDPDLGAPNMFCDNPGFGEGKGGKPGKTYENCEPRGNVLIIDENGPDMPPDDSKNGGKIRITFEFPTDMEEICFLDNDSAEQTQFSVSYFLSTLFISSHLLLRPLSSLTHTPFTVSLLLVPKLQVFFADGSDPIKKIAVPKLGDNGYGCIPMPYKGVSKINVLMDGSGSISDIKYQMCGKKKGGGGGDPHFKRWNRERSTFHGECDMVMASSKQFHNGAGFDMHVRTTIRHDLYSYFKSAAIRIGTHILEVTKEYVLLDGKTYQHQDLPLTFGDDEYQYTIDNAEIEAHKDPTNRHYYKLDLHDNSYIKFEWYRHLLNMEIEGDERDFGDSVGMLGEYKTGDMFGRHGQPMDDFNEYGFEWQVDPSQDPILFEEARSPQLPYEKCRMPSHTFSTHRRLRADKALMEAAEQACASKEGGEVLLCVQDVLMTGDVEMANTW